MHLKRAGVPKEDMLRLYFSLLRPVLDFAAPAYHSLLTMAQSNRLEAIQAKAMKIIYGWTVSYETVIEKTGLERLALRRAEIVDKFASKAEKMPRFWDTWFTPRVPNRPGMRRNERFQHQRYRTERYKKNPVNFM